MSDHNGGKPAIPFPGGGANIPIVGQPFAIGAFTVTALLVCQCRGFNPMLVMMNEVSYCPSCGNGWTIQGIVVQPGQPPRFKIGKVEPQSAPQLGGSTP